jgi:hypothetical protein
MGLGRARGLAPPAPAPHPDPAASPPGQAHLAESAMACMARASPPLLRVRATGGLATRSHIRAEPSPSRALVPPPAQSRSAAAGPAGDRVAAGVDLPIAGRPFVLRPR